MHVHSAFSQGESTLEELASTAKELGYKGICFVFYWLGKREDEIIKAEIERIEKEFGIKTFLGYEARNLKELRFLAKIRKSFDFLLVRGGNLQLNRIACETPEVDILTHPSLGRKDPGINHIMAKRARKNEVAIEINFRELLTSSKRSRVETLRKMREIVKIAKKYKTPLLISSGAISHWELKDPKVLISLGIALGLELKEAKKCISSLPKEMIKKILERKDERWILPGLKIVKR